MIQTSNAAEQSIEGRGLSTARAVLKVLTFLGEHPEGVRAHDVAGVVGKSLSTAYYLLASLCEEGFAVRDPRGGRYRLRSADYLRGTAPAHAAAGSGRDLETAVHTLLLRTHKRSYLGRMKAGALEIVAVRGRQGMATIPGLGTRIQDCAHAVAMGKVVLALSSREARTRYALRGLRRFTATTVVSPRALDEELAIVRRQGFAVEREEFQADFCCVAAPIRGPEGRVVAVLGLSATTRAYDAEREQLIEAVLDVSRLSSTHEKTPISCVASA